MTFEILFIPINYLVLNQFNGIQLILEDNSQFRNLLMYIKVGEYNKTIKMILIK